MSTPARPATSRRRLTLVLLLCAVAGLSCRANQDKVTAPPTELVWDESAWDAVAWQ